MAKFDPETLTLLVGPTAFEFDAEALIDYEKETEGWNPAIKQRSGKYQYYYNRVTEKNDRTVRKFFFRDVDGNKVTFETSSDWDDYKRDWQIGQWYDLKFTIDD